MDSSGYFKTMTVTSVYSTTLRIPPEVSPLKYFYDKLEQYNEQRKSS